jgi:hypothetical protein
MGVEHLGEIWVPVWYRDFFARFLRGVFFLTAGGFWAFVGIWDGCSMVLKPEGRIEAPGKKLGVEDHQLEEDYIHIN